MAGVAALGYVFCIVVAVTVVWLVARRRPQRLATLAPPLRTLLHSGRRRAVTAIAFSGTVFVAFVVAGFALPDLVGLPFLVAPALGGTAGLLLYSATPPRVLPVDGGTPRVASLTRRTPWSYLPRVGSVVLVVLVLTEVGFSVFTGLTSSPDELGRYRAIGFEVGDFATRSTPYAGWFYGVPLLLVTALLAGATIVALWRVSSTPALPQQQLANVDAGWRRATGRILLTISGSAVLLQFGGVALVSGMSLRNAFVEGVPPVWDGIGQVLEGAGVLMMVGSVVALTLAALWALALPGLATRSRMRTFMDVARPVPETVRG